MAENAPVVLLEAEEGLIGSMIMSGGKTLDVVQSELRLQAEHFYRDSHRIIFRAIAKMRDNEDGIDALTVSDQLKRDGELEDAGGKSYVHQLAGSASLGLDRQYAGIVIDAARWRKVQQAAHLLQQAAALRDDEKFAQAEALLEANPIEMAGLTASPEQLADEFWDHMTSGSEAFSFPFERLNQLTGGGMRRGQVTLLGGWTSHGKSIFLDQLLEHAANKGLKAHLFINEMSRIERTARTVSRRTGISTNDLLVPREKQLAFDQASERNQKILRALSDLPFGITNASDLSADDIAREIRRGGYDVVGIDILHLIDHADEADMRQISRTINRASKAGRGCHVVATVHLNEHRAHRSAVLPMPQLGDIRQSGMLKNDADNVLFLWREQTERGSPKPEGSLYFRKVRSGQIGGMKIVMNRERMRFDRLAREGE